MFFEKTKKIYESWYENILGLIFKPMFNLALLIMYLNIMDTFLLKDVTFGDHSNLGRDPAIICPSNSLSFYCIINKNIIGIVDIIKSILDNGLVTLGINILLVFLFFKLGDNIIEELEKLINSIFKIGSDGANVTGLGGIEGNKGGLAANEGTSSAMGFGKKLDNFRDTYMRGGVIAAMSAAKGEISSAMSNHRDKQKDVIEYKSRLKDAYKASAKIEDLKNDIRDLNKKLRKASTETDRNKIVDKITKKASEIRQQTSKLKKAQHYMNEEIEIKDKNGNVIGKKSRKEFMDDYDNETARKAVAIEDFSLVRKIGSGLQHLYTKKPSTNMFKTSIQDKVNTASGWLGSKFHKEEITTDIKKDANGKETVEQAIAPSPTFFDKFIFTRGFKKMGRGVSTLTNNLKIKSANKKIAENKTRLYVLTKGYTILKKKLDEARENSNISEKDIQKLEDEVANKGAEVLELENEIGELITKRNEYNRIVNNNKTINDKVNKKDSDTDNEDNKTKKKNKEEDIKNKEEELQKKKNKQDEKMKAAKELDETMKDAEGLDNKKK